MQNKNAKGMSQAYFCLHIKLEIMEKKLTLPVLILFFSIPLWAQNNLPYLGQSPPGMSALRFPPDSLLANSQWMWHGSPVFSCDGSEMFWTEYSEPAASTYKLEIFTMCVENNNWSPMHRPEFADTGYKENNPLFSAGDDSLYYYSARTTSFINRAVRTATGWGQPEALQIPIPPGYYYGSTFAVAKNMNVYLDLFDPSTNEGNIWVSQFQNGNYQFPQVLGPEINSAYSETCPFIDPDENYLLFGSNRPGGYGGQVDLYICFRNADQTWTDAINMGFEINSTGAFFPVVTLDKQYLFFNTAKPGDIGYNPYWISADIIDSLQVLVGIGQAGKYPEPLKLYQNQPNPVRDQTTFFFEPGYSGKLSLEIFSLPKGWRRVLFEDKFFQKGKHSVAFDASELPAGMYLYNLTSAAGGMVTGKMVVIK
jgi:hypothetical protein